MTALSSGDDPVVHKQMSEASLEEHRHGQHCLAMAMGYDAAVTALRTTAGTAYAHHQEQAAQQLRAAADGLNATAERWRMRAFHPDWKEPDD